MPIFEPIKHFIWLMKYNWQQDDWPHFTYQLTGLEAIFFAITEETGHISGMLKALPPDIQTETIINIMVAEAMKTSAIEGEYLSRPDVVSSVRKNLGLNIPDNIKDKRAKGAGALMVMVRNSFAEPLTASMLFAWHTTLLEHAKNIATGAWRSPEEPMRVVSGMIGKEVVHFEAPPSDKVPQEMDRFIEWFNNTAPGKSGEIRVASVRAALAHLYFESIHPFEDGNGRIGRAIAEKALSQTIGRPILMSLSQTIEAEKRNYYAALEQAQRGNEVSDWLRYFVTLVHQAQVSARELVDFTLHKVNFIDRHRAAMNERQLKAILKMLESPEGFQGGMTARKYVSITKASKATATRDLQLLVESGILNAVGAGRSIHYILNFDV